MSEMTKLVGNQKAKNEGNFVLYGQKMAVESGFNHVNASWLSGTLTYEQGFELLEKDRAKTHDVLASLSEVNFGVSDHDKFVVNIGSNGYHPTVHAVKQMATWAKTGSFLPENLLQHVLDEEENEVLVRDKEDAETLVTIFKNGFRRLDQQKKFLWRLREDGTMRAMLSDIYARVDNRWMLELVQSLLPGGRLSHWETDADTIWGNVLLPDSIRQEDDSDYGAMLSLGNSEIGERKYSSLPSIFRAICMNGCIWGQTKGIAVKQVHRGKINLQALAETTAESIKKQLDIISPAIDTMLATRGMKWSGISAKPVVASLAQKHKLSKKQATEVLNAYAVEVGKVKDYENTLFALLNAVTRAGQKFDHMTWVKFDELGGTLAAWDKSAFASVIEHAKTLKEEDVEEMFINKV